MKRALFLVASALTAPACAGGPVVAVSEPVVQVDPAPSASGTWTGFYLGFNATKGSIDDGTFTADPGG